MSVYANYPQKGKFPLAVRLQEHGSVLFDHFFQHEYSQILIVTKGHAYHQIENRKLLISEDDVLVLHPGTKNLFSEGVDFEIFEILYDSCTPLPALTGSKLPFLDYLYPLDSFQYDQLAPVTKIPYYDHELYLNLVRRLSYETHRMRVGHNIMIPTMFTELAIYLARGNSETQEKDRTWLIQSPVEYLNAHCDEPLNLSKLCRMAGMCERTLFRHFKKELGTTPMQYLHKLRVRRVMNLLEHSGRSISEIAMQCGFCDSNHMTKIFRAQTGTTPFSFRAKKRAFQQLKQE